MRKGEGAGESPSRAASAARSFRHYPSPVFGPVDSNLGLPSSGPNGCQRPLGCQQNTQALVSQKSGLKYF